MQKMGSPPSPHISLLAESTVEPFPDSMGSINDITNIFLVQLQLLLLRKRQSYKATLDGNKLLYFVLFLFGFKHQTLAC